MEFELNNRVLRYEDNDNIFIWCNGGNYKNNPIWKKLSICNNGRGYKCILIYGKMYLLHRIIAMLFLKLNIEDSKQVIDHIDGNKQNNNIENLRIVTQQQNTFNRKVKGICFFKNKFQAQININGKQIYLGRFNNEEEAHQAYINAKQIYHIIN